MTNPSQSRGFLFASSSSVGTVAILHSNIRQRLGERFIRRSCRPADHHKKDIQHKQRDRQIVEHDSQPAVQAKPDWLPKKRKQSPAAAPSTVRETEAGERFDKRGTRSRSCPMRM